MLGDKVQKIPLRHEGDEPAMRRQAGKVCDLHGIFADLAAERLGFLVRALQEFTEQPEFVHDLKGRGCIVSPRKSRRKSACFSRTRTETPARAKRKPSIMPAGPPPAMQQLTVTSPASIALLVARLCPHPIHRGPHRKRSGGNALHGLRRGRMNDLLKGFELFEPRRFLRRDVVSVGGAIRFTNRGLSGNSADGRAPRDTFFAQEGCNRCFVIGRQHGGLPID